MPATEIPHYPTPRRHGLLAAVSLLLLAATGWMIGVDRNRPWHGYQRAARQRVEPWRAVAGADGGVAIAFAPGGAEPDGPRRGDAARRGLEIEQCNLPELPLDRHFAPVERVDRCTTCHAAMDTPVFGAEVVRRLGGDGEAIFPPEEVLTLRLAIPPTPPIAASSSERRSEAGARGASAARATGAPDTAARIELVLGFALAPEGVLARDEALVARVLPRSPAAWAGLRPGDVLLAVGRRRVADAAGAAEQLVRELEVAQQGRGPAEVALDVRRGLPHPYAAHPRLDLFVGATSPHPRERFGCTICHEGEGSATDFARAAHQPDSPAQRRRWEAALGWSPRPHVPRPMLPARYAESRCTLCHHEVLDLAASDRWPQPPAPKLIEGYRLVRELGCFGCHEIRGFDAEGRAIGPDLRLEPDGGVGPADPPGTLRKVGPTLRRAADKTDRRYLLDRLADPARFLPNSRMPRMFGMHDHLDGPQRDEARRFETVEMLAVAEYVMSAGGVGGGTTPGATIGAVDQGAADRADGGADERRDDRVRVERGRRLFGQRGCLACHAHADFPGGGGTLGPDLSGVGLKYASPSAARWLAEWLRDPGSIHPRTRMPNLLLSEPAPSFGDRLAVAAPAFDASADRRAGSAVAPPVGSSVASAVASLGGSLAAPPVGSSVASRAEPPTEPPAGSGAESRDEPRTEPLAGSGAEPRAEAPAGSGAEPTESPRDAEDRIGDLVAFLMASTGAALGAPRPWTPPEIPRLIEADLDALAAIELASSLPREAVDRALREGVEPAQRARLPRDAQAMAERPSLENKLRYVGARTIARRGCFGCHDIPGFERAEWIGPALSDWGSKPVERLGFDRVAEFVLASRADPEHSAPAGASDSRRGGAGGPSAADTDFHLDALVERRREGFLWQKLAAPRSFDYGVAAGKGYTQWLTMGRFALDDAQREAIATFVLGLVGGAPPRHVARLHDRRRALAEGRKRIDELGCAECHVFGLECWTIEYAAGGFPPPPQVETFAGLEPEPAAAAMARSREPDLRGQARSVLLGSPRVDAQGRLVEQEDDEGNPLHFFTLWRPAAIDARAWVAGGADVPVPAAALVARREPWGGRLARWLYPVALQRMRAAGAEVAADAAWGWLPPPLVDQGVKVRSGWLTDYLLDPRPIRPTSLMRMPRYHLSRAEARRLADYFAATADADGQAVEQASRQSPGSAANAASIDRRRRQAMSVLIDRTTFCLKCHEVGPGDESAGNVSGAGGATRAPRLDQVAVRLEAAYLRRWIARPRSILPYTPMPVHFPPSGPAVGQDLLPGTSAEQIEALVDLLLHYDEFLRDRIAPSALIGSEAPPGEGRR